MPANQHSFNSLANETTPATGDAKALAEELTALMRQQTEALERATYLKMSEAESSAYDERRERIVQLWELLRGYRLKFP